MTTEIVIFLAIQFLIEFHFASVFYQHWKNSNKQKKHGGLVEDSNEQNGVEFADVIPNDLNASLPSQLDSANHAVQHAIDDEDLRRTTQSM